MPRLLAAYSCGGSRGFVAGMRRTSFPFHGPLSSPTRIGREWPMTIRKVNAEFAQGYIFGSLWP